MILASRICGRPQGVTLHGTVALLSFEVLRWRPCGPNAQR